MGTLGSQSIRDRHIVCFEELEHDIVLLRDIARRRQVELADVIAFYAVLTQQSRVAAYIDNGDNEDENLAGLGNIFEQGFLALKEAIEKLAPITD